MSPLDLSEDDATFLPRVVGLLTRSVSGNRQLDCMVAKALGWQCKVEAGVVMWRRYRLTWERQNSHSVPPRYTGGIDVLLAELPAHQTLTLFFGQGPCRAQLGTGDEMVIGIGYDAVLGLAAAIVESKMHAVER